MIDNYWIKRLSNNYKKNGLKKFILNLFIFLNKFVNPKYVGEIPFKFLFLKKRRALRKFAKENLDSLESNIIQVGNYLLDIENLNSKSIVYSFGIGENIFFEQKLEQKINCKVFCFDPTSLACNYMNKINYNTHKIEFKPIGIWKNDGKIKFYRQSIDAPKNTGGSITNFFQNASYDIYDCYTLKSIMRSLNHSRIDLLKLDIEGAAIDVIKNLIDDEIFPEQIVAEFEYSKDDSFDEENFDKWTGELLYIFNSFRERNYRIFYLPRFTHMPFSTLEVLFLKK